MTAGRTAGLAQSLARDRRLLAALTLSLLALAGLPTELPTMVTPARALSCIPADIHDQLRDARFAFIGRPTAEVPAPQPGPRQFLFEVEVWVKGNLGSPVMVRGFEWSTPVIGERMAMIVGVNEDGSLRDLECVGTQPETLLAIAELESEARSTDPPALLVGGEFGPARLMALDGRGRLVGLAPGDGAVVGMTSCPGSRRSVELVADSMPGEPAFEDMGFTQMIAVRDLATLDVVREAALPFSELGFAWPAALSCRDENGDEVVFGLPGEGILRFTDGVEPLHAGAFTPFAVGSSWAVIADDLGAPEEGGPVSLNLLDLATGDQIPLPQPPEPAEPVAFALSRDETRLAYFARTPSNTQRAGMFVHVFDLAGADLLASQRLPAPEFCHSCWGDVAWLDNDRLLVRDRQWNERDELLSAVRIFDLPGLELVDEWRGGQADVAQVAAGVLLTVDRETGSYRLTAMGLDDGRQVDVRVIGTSNATALLALPTFDEAAADAYTSQVPPSPTPHSPAPGTPEATTGNTPDQPPTPGQPGATDLLVPAALVILAGVLIGATLVWRRRPRVDSS